MYTQFVTLGLSHTPETSTVNVSTKKPLDQFVPLQVAIHLTKLRESHVTSSTNLCQTGETKDSPQKG